MNHYLSDPGIKLKNKNYYYKNKLVTDPVLLEKLSKIRVPPAWKSVWYASIKNHTSLLME